MRHARAKKVHSFSEKTVLIYRGSPYRIYGAEIMNFNTHRFANLRRISAIDRLTDGYYNILRAPKPVPICSDMSIGYSPAIPI